MNVFSLRDRRKEETRERVLGAAAREFRVHGFEGASIRGIAARAGVAAGTVMTVAPSKLDLLHRVLEDRLNDAVGRACDVPANGPVVEQLVRMASAFFDTFAAEPELYVRLLSHSLWSIGPASAAFEAQVRVVAADAGRRVRAARPDLDDEGVVLAFLGAYYFALIVGLRDTKPDSARMQEMVRRSVSTCLGSTPPGAQRTPSS